MSSREVLKQAEAAWIAQSTEEAFFFRAFDEPKLLRRSQRVPGALASLDFGRYQAMDRQWIEHEPAVWIGMITSDIPGDGRRLLGALQRNFGNAGLVLIGTPNALKPRDWAEDRPFDYRPETLIRWYLDQGFRVVQDGSETRVVYSVRSSALVTAFRLA